MSLWVYIRQKKKCWIRHTDRYSWSSRELLNESVFMILDIINDSSLKGEKQKTNMQLIPATVLSKFQVFLHNAAASALHD